MTFRTLEQRFKDRFGIADAPQDPPNQANPLENVPREDLYEKATDRFLKGVVNTDEAAQPYIVRIPGEGYWDSPDSILGRALPVRSVAEDVKRLVAFSKSNLLFYGKQQLLQTGNTFEITRFLNPLFVVGAAATPAVGNFLRVRRTARPLGDLLFRTDTTDANVRKMGQLQFETYQSIQTKYKQYTSNFSVNVFKQKTSTPGVLGRTFNFGKQLLSPVTNTATALFAKRNIGEKFGYGEDGWVKTRPELGGEGTYTSFVDAQIKLYKAGSSTYGIPTRRISTMMNSAIYGRDVDNPYFIYGNGTVKDLSNTNARDIAKDTPTIVYITDPLNTVIENPQSLLDNMLLRNPNVQPPLSSYSGLLKEKESDIIYVAFAMGDRMPIQFRAYIKDVNQSITPEYKPYQYIGRPEKFFSYVSTQREVSFKLGVIALGEKELNTVWTRINYLTGLVYPFGITRGIYQPNIVRMTLGNLYVEQPGYVTSLTTNFNEISETWDITAEVPIAAQMDIKFTVLEKRSKTANSPFYGITERAGNFTNSEELFFGDSRIKVVRDRIAEQQKQEAERAISQLVSEKFSGYLFDCKDGVPGDENILTAKIPTSGESNDYSYSEVLEKICASYKTDKASYEFCSKQVNDAKTRLPRCYRPLPPSLNTQPAAVLPPSRPTIVPTVTGVPAINTRAAGGIGTAATTPPTGQ